MFPDAPIEEWHTGEFTYLGGYKTAMTMEDRRADREAYWQRSDPYYRHNPEVETFNDFITRVSDNLDKLCQLKDKTILFFGHQQFMLAMLWLNKGEHAEINEQSMREFKQFMADNKIPNGSLVSFDIDEKKWDILFEPEKSS